MGRIFNQRTYKTTAIFLGLMSFSAMTPLMTDAQAVTAVAQTKPALSSSQPLARDTSTFETDKALNAACRQNGQSNSAITREACLCVTHILKYELTLAEYRAAVRIYGRPQDRTTLYAELRHEGYSASAINAAERMERTLMTSPDFSTRCAKAKAYYK